MMKPLTVGHERSHTWIFFINQPIHTTRTISIHTIFAEQGEVFSLKQAPLHVYIPRAVAEPYLLVLLSIIVDNIKQLAIVHNPIEILYMTQMTLMIKCGTVYSSILYQSRVLNKKNLYYYLGMLRPL